LLLGVDIVDVARIKKTVLRTSRFLQQIFTEKEQAYCLGKKNPYPSLAARFAAKEAVRKLDAVFLSGISWNEIEVLNEKGGKPVINLRGKAAQKAEETGIHSLVISLSHTDEQAIAIVLAAKG
jgi:holo-[acyl-carrier protein] synthase